MKKHIVVLPGDGIGPEVVKQAIVVLQAIEKKGDISFTLQEELIGGSAIDKAGSPFPSTTLEACKQADAILLGAVGGPKWDALPSGKRPESGLLALRKELGLFANLRPAVVFPELAELSCLKEEKIKNGIDILVVRELTGDVYFGQPAALEERNGTRVGYNTMIYDEHEIRRIAKIAFLAARSRKKRVCSIDKANVLHVSRLWRTVLEEVHEEFSDVELSHMYVDNCAMQLVINPAQFDVIVTGNIFGDILSDEAAAVAGSLGMLPSASLSGMPEDGGIGLYEPIHGSAPDIAGQNKANPLATILSVALMLRMSFGLLKEADAIEAAVRKVLKDGHRTGDIAKDRSKAIGCKEIGALVVKNIQL